MKGFNRWPLRSMILAACLAGCSPAPEPRSIKFYEDNSAERNATLQRCRELMEDPSKDADCTNAQRWRQAREKRSRPWSRRGRRLLSSLSQ